MHKIELTKPIKKIENKVEDKAEQEPIQKESSKNIEIEILNIFKELMNDTCQSKTDINIEFLKQQMDSFDRRLLIVETLLNYLKQKI